MTVRQLQPEEWGRIEKIFLREFSELPPHPEGAVVVVAEEGGEIVGLGTVQLIAHVEPFWIKPQHRGKDLMSRLIRKLYELVPGVTHAFAYSKDPRGGALLAHFGMKEMVGWKSYRWLRKENVDG